MDTQSSSNSSSDTEELVGATAGAEPADPLRKLAEKNKSELMFELRNISHGEKPVTGQDSRERLNDFFSKRLHAAEVRENNPTAPSNVDDTELHRPEQVVIEVTTLIERRPVQSILSSPAFRRQLERVVRSNISNIIGTPIVSSSSASSSSTTPSVSSVSTSSSSLASSTVSSSTSAPINNQPAPQAPSRPVNHNQRVPQPPPVPTLPPLDQHVPIIVNRAVNEGEILRENVREEITELVHNQIVTSTLESPFRGRLENTIEEHLRASGVDGERVERFIRSLATEPVIRNDFSHLGIDSGPHININDDSDTVSVISATTHSVPYAQSNRALRGELRELRSQMEEMKSMMQLSFELQMDIQRSIRQEVAAALTHVLAENIVPPVQSSAVREGKCVICLDKDSDSVFYQCGHLCCCTACGMNLKLQGAKCPVCRAPIKDLLRVYKSGHKD